MFCLLPVYGRVRDTIIRIIPSKNCLARNIQILQVFFLEDLALNLASLALKMKLFLQDMKNLARKLSYNFFLQDSCKIFYILQEKLHF